MWQHPQTAALPCVTSLPRINDASYQALSQKPPASYTTLRPSITSSLGGKCTGRHRTTAWFELNYLINVVTREINGYNSRWATNTREHSLDFREHPLDPRKPSNTTQGPRNTSRATNRLTPMAQAQVNIQKGRKRGKKCTFFHIIRDSHWKRLLTWASEHNRRYPHRPTEARKEERDLKNRTIKSEADTLYRRGPTLLSPQYPYRYNSCLCLCGVIQLWLSRYKGGCSLNDALIGI